jgi:hypothetical protein
VSDIEGKSYRYLRMTIVVLPLGLAVAVVYQIAVDHFRILGSVSAYYHTPAQAIFVSALIAIGACMVALKGTTELEDIFLNLGGMFAAVVAIIPTARQADFASTVNICRETAGAATAPTDLLEKCGSVEGLLKTTTENVQNNMTALLVLGALGLVITVTFALADRKTDRAVAAKKLAWGLGVSVVLLALGWFALLMYTEWLVLWGHYIAASGLSVCIFVVTVANALRRQGTPLPTGSLPRQVAGTASAARRALFRWPLDAYAWVAWAMIGNLLIMGTLWGLSIVTLFWFEIALTVGFIAFWLVQTVELMGDPSGQGKTPDDSGPARAEAPPTVSEAAA